MSRIVRFTVPLEPVGQPRPRATVRGPKRAGVYEVTKLDRRDEFGRKVDHPIVAFRKLVELTARQAMAMQPMQGPVRVDMVLLFERPGKLQWKTKPMPRVRHTASPDCDNVAKAVLDAMNEVAWRDDSQVCQLWIEKWVAGGFEQPGVQVRVEELA